MSAMSDAVDERGPGRARLLVRRARQRRIRQQRKVWFAKDEAFDAAIRRALRRTDRAGPARRARRLGRCAALGALARILLLDQFTRNAFRGQPRTFAGDAQALAAASAMVGSRSGRGAAAVHARASSTCRSSTPRGWRCRTSRSVSSPGSWPKRPRPRRDARLRAPASRRDRALRPIPASQRDPRPRSRRPRKSRTSPRPGSGF